MNLPTTKIIAKVNSKVACLKTKSHLNVCQPKAPFERLFNASLIINVIYHINCSSNKNKTSTFCRKLK